MDNANAASADSQKKSSSLTTRVVSAVVAIPIVLAVTWISYWTMALAVAVGLVIGLIELYRLFAHAGYQPRVAVGIASGLALVVAAICQRILPNAPILGLALTLIVIGSLVAEIFTADEQRSLTGWGMTLAGAVYLGWLGSHLLLLRGLGDQPITTGPLTFTGMPLGVAWLFLLFVTTWLNDSLAYFVGRSLGKHRMTPVLSPKKTWEGAIGGLVGSVIGSVLSVWLFGLPITLLLGVALGVIAGIVGPLGDLAESFIKRQTGMKDAGTLFPGHGGILDRADSLVFNGAVLYYVILLIQAN